MQFLGYLITSIGSMFIIWKCYEKLFTPRHCHLALIISAFTLGAIFSIAQTFFSFDENLNSITNVAIFFALTFLYSAPCIQRFFTALFLFVLNVLGEGTGCIFARILFRIDLTTINETIYFPAVCLICIIIQAIYALLVVYSVNYFRNHPQKIKNFIFILITILVFGIIDLLVTFTATAYLIPALILSILLIVAIASCLYLFNDQLRIQRERMQLAHLEEMQQDQVQHYNALYEANRQVAVQRHDLKNILLNVRSYIEVGEIEKLDKYVAKFQEKLQPSKMIDNGMPFIDAVLSAKMTEHPEIPFDHNISLLELEHITQPQIAFILATALDNAIEACSQSEKPFIKVRLNQQGHMVSLVVVNAADQPIKAIGDTLLTTKTDSTSHGYGVKSMKQAAEQAHGMLTWSYEQQTFTLSVLLQDIAD